MDTTNSTKTPTSPVWAILRNEKPHRFVYAPNYWQWFTHRLNHNNVPKEIKHCKTQLDVIQYLNLDVFSRNIYSDPYKYWFGGLSAEIFDGVESREMSHQDGKDISREKIYNTKNGRLTERLRYVMNESTLVTEKYLIDDYKNQLAAFKEFIQARSWRFDAEKYKTIQNSVENRGVVIAGELCSPLKMLHFYVGLIDTTYLLVDFEKKALELMQIHEEQQLELLKQMLQAGVKVVMSMDNLDASFHPPDYVEKYSASFYEKASALAHQYKSRFFIHACGQQKANLSLISSLGVDGLEGLVYPPLGDIEMEEALKMTHDRFIITGGISAHETRNLTEKKEIFDYVKNLFDRVRPYSNRFIFSASCNTAIDTSWETIKHFRDAWSEYNS
ncbi:hypothetical protein GF407_06925 [candidate division KSB1 bacterium]|nr:hypothetical protein [candidate division KSB1 bacterium]